MRVGNSISHTISLSTGLPQSGVLSPLIFTLTCYCFAKLSTNYVIKDTNGTTVLDLIRHTIFNISNNTVESVQSTKFLGMQITKHHISSQWSPAAIALSVTDENNTPSILLITFYRGTTKMVLTSCISVWFGACKGSDWKSVQGIVQRKSLGPLFHLSRILHTNAIWLATLLLTLATPIIDCLSCCPLARDSTAYQTVEHTKVPLPPKHTITLKDCTSLFM